MFCFFFAEYTAQKRGKFNRKIKKINIITRKKNIYKDTKNI